MMESESVERQIGGVLQEPTNQEKEKERQMEQKQANGGVLQKPTYQEKEKERQAQKEKLRVKDDHQRYQAFLNPFIQRLTTIDTRVGAIQNEQTTKKRTTKEQCVKIVGIIFFTVIWIALLIKIGLILKGDHKMEDYLDLAGCFGGYFIYEKIMDYKLQRRRQPVDRRQPRPVDRQIQLAAQMQQRP